MVAEEDENEYVVENGKGNISSDLNAFLDLFDRKNPTMGSMGDT